MPTSNLAGVFPTTASNRCPFQAKIYRGGKQFYLGSYPTDAEAAASYDVAVLLTQPWGDGPLNYPTYSKLPQEFIDNAERPEFSGDPSSLNQRFVSNYDQHWKMLEWLRRHDPDAEQRWKDTAAIRAAEARVNEEVGAETLVTFEGLCTSLDSTLRRERALVNQIFRKNKELAGVIVKREERIKFLEGQLAELEEELVGLRHMKSVGPIVFKKLEPNTGTAQTVTTEVPSPSAPEVP